MNYSFSKLIFSLENSLIDYNQLIIIIIRLFRLIIKKLKDFSLNILNKTILFVNKIFSSNRKMLFVSFKPLFQVSPKLIFKNAHFLITVISGFSRIYSGFSVISSLAIKSIMFNILVRYLERNFFLF